MKLLERSIRGFAWNHVARVLDYGLTYVLSIILARAFEPAEYGIYVTVMSVASAAIIIGGLGLDETLNKFAAQSSSRSDEGKLRFLVRHLLGWRVAALVVLFGALFLFRNELSEVFHDPRIPQYILILSLYTVTQSLVNFVTNIHTSLLQTQYVFLVILVSKLLNIAVAVILLSMGYGIPEILVLLTATSVVSLIAYGFTVRRLLAGNAEPIPMDPMRRFSTTMWFNALMALLLGRHAVILITGSTFGTGELSAYVELAFSLTLWIEYVFSIGFVGVILSVFSELAATNPEKLPGARTNVIRYYQVFIIPVATFCLLYAEGVISFLFTDKYLPAVPLFRWYLAFNVVSIAVIGGGTHMTLLLAKGKERIVLIIRSIVSVANVAGIYYVAPLYGGVGIVVVTGTCVLVKFLVESLVASSLIGFSYDPIFLLKVVVASVVPIWPLGLIGDGWSVVILTPIYVVLVVAGYFVLRLFSGPGRNILRGTNLRQMLRSIARVSD